MWEIDRVDGSAPRVPARGLFGAAVTDVAELPQPDAPVAAVVFRQRSVELQAALDHRCGEQVVARGEVTEYRASVHPRDVGYIVDGEVQTVQRQPSLSGEDQHIDGGLVGSPPGPLAQWASFNS